MNEIVTFSNDMRVLTITVI